MNCMEHNPSSKANSLSASQETELSLVCLHWTFSVKGESFPHPRMMFICDPSVGEQAANLKQEP